ncbi:CRISPR-associated endonuclease Cas3'' [Rhizobium leguminosarum]|uniref:CRISPR-associated endonuclease Cas3 n=1 Tax=Rhizobium leguminosarum TaxID=384 RepID=A0A1L3ZE31_RHILE|nr:CRISPR-associated endonuclease Cas3'' [Rhizobium leguminosarum]API53841.1 CRISPR-associated endonuclease Cas3'' [Rhizobium leguminosarum]
MDYFAHSGKEPDKSDWQILSEHLHGVAKMAAEMAAPFGLERAAYIAGLFHDLGKYKPAFQRRLDGVEIGVDHSTAGASLMLGDFATGLDKGMAELVAYCIAGHHTGLPDRRNASAACLEQRLAKDAEPLDEIWRTQLTSNAKGLVPAFVSNFRKADPTTAAFQFSVMGRMIFSCLIDADYKDTEAFYHALEGRAADRDWASLQDVLPQFRSVFDAHMTAKAKGDGELNRPRGRILSHVRQKAEEKPGLFTLTVPTGGGKTLASLQPQPDRLQA